MNQGKRTRSGPTLYHDDYPWGTTFAPPPSRPTLHLSALVLNGAQRRPGPSRLTNPAWLLRHGNLHPAGQGWARTPSWSKKAGVGSKSLSELISVVDLKKCCNNKKLNFFSGRQAARSAYAAQRLR